MLVPAADGSTETPSLFAQKDGLSTDDPVSFEFVSAEPLRGGALWLRYRVRNDR